jgi:hypothetical protein
MKCINWGIHFTRLATACGVLLLLVIARVSMGGLGVTISVIEVPQHRPSKHAEGMRSFMSENQVVAVRTPPKRVASAGGS